MPTPTRLKCPCNSCQRDTQHELLFETKDGGSEEIADDFSIEWGVKWQVVQCRGCNSVTMIRNAWNSEALDDRGRPEVETSFFPPRTFRAVPAWLHANILDPACPDEIERLMRELYVALQNECNAAATMLTRAIFEHTMIAKVGDLGGFAANMAAFTKQGFISVKQANVVESMLEAGHASIHRAFIPKTSDIVTLVDILESVLQVVFVHMPKAEELRNRIPKRKK